MKILFCEFVLTYFSVFLNLKITNSVSKCAVEENLEPNDKLNKRYNHNAILNLKKVKKITRPTLSPKSICFDKKIISQIKLDKFTITFSNCENLYKKKKTSNSYDAKSHNNDDYENFNNEIFIKQLFDLKKKVTISQYKKEIFCCKDLLLFKPLYNNFDIKNPKTDINSTHQESVMQNGINPFNENCDKKNFTTKVFLNRVETRTSQNLKKKDFLEFFAVREFDLKKYFNSFVGEIDLKNFENFHNFIKKILFFGNFIFANLKIELNKAKIKYKKFKIVDKQTLRMVLDAFFIKVFRDQENLIIAFPFSIGLYVYINTDDMNFGILEDEKLFSEFIAFLIILDLFLNMPITKFYNDFKSNLKSFFFEKKLSLINENQKCLNELHNTISEQKIFFLKFRLEMNKILDHLLAIIYPPEKYYRFQNMYNYCQKNLESCLKCNFVNCNFDQKHQYNYSKIFFASEIQLLIEEKYQEKAMIELFKDKLTEKKYKSLQFDLQNVLKKSLIFENINFKGIYEQNDFEFFQKKGNFYNIFKVLYIYSFLFDLLNELDSIHKINKKWITLVNSNVSEICLLNFDRFVHYELDEMQIIYELVKLAFKIFQLNNHPIFFFDHGIDLSILLDNLIKKKQKMMNIYKF